MAQQKVKQSIIT